MNKEYNIISKYNSSKLEGPSNYMIQEGEDQYAPSERKSMGCGHIQPNDSYKYQHSSKMFNAIEGTKPILLKIHCGLRHIFKHMFGCHLEGHFKATQRQIYG